jgi:hypothetical protein
MYTPSAETINVLKQAGYHPKTLKSAIKEFAGLQEKFSDLIGTTDKEFFTYLKTKYIKESIVIDNNLDSGTSWRPGKEEIKKLEEEGYWREIIMDVLGDFLFRPERRGIVISRFAVFRSYLRNRFPLESVDTITWEPNPLLKKLIWQDLAVQNKTYDSFMPYFRQLAIKKRVSGKLLPKFFYNFVKRNQTRIVECQKIKPTVF